MASLQLLTPSAQINSWAHVESTLFST